MATKQFHIASLNVSILQQIHSEAVSQFKRVSAMATSSSTNLQSFSIMPRQGEVRRVEAFLASHTIFTISREERG